MGSSTLTHVSAQQTAATFTNRRRTIALIIVSLAFVMDLLDSTIVNIAIPSIQANLHASYTAIQWLIAGYLLSFATLLITGGRMGDVFGYKKLFLTGISGFTVASLLSGIAWNPDILIVARLIQGSMAAMMVPQVMSLMQVMYKPSERGSIMGLFGALGGLSATLGPIIGGLLIQANIAGLDWRPIFLINVPLGITALIAGSIVLPHGKSEHPLKIDLFGTFLVVVAFLLLIYPLVEGRDLGWPLWIFAMMIGALPVLGLFARYERSRQQRGASPLVESSMFRVRSFVAGLAVNFFFEILFIGYFLIFTLTLQAGLDYSVIKAALTGIPFAIGIGVSIGAVGPKLVKRYGRNVIFLGMTLLAVGYSLIALILHHYNLAVTPFELAVPLLVAGTGAGLIMAPIFSVVLSHIDVKHAGSASGVLNAIQQVGGAVGIALIGVIFFGQLTHSAPLKATAALPALRTALTAEHIPAGAQTQLSIAFTTCFNDRAAEKDSSVTPASCQAATSTPGLSTQVATSIDTALARAGRDANAHNFAAAFSWSIVFEVILIGVTACLAFLLPREINVAPEGI